jgi:hypothetical protein
MAMRPKISSSTPHTTSGIEEAPVSAIDPPDPEPPAPATVVDVTALTVNVTVRWGLIDPVMVTVYVPGVVGAAVNEPVAVPTPVVTCCGRLNPAAGATVVEVVDDVTAVTGAAHVVVVVVGVDWGWEKVIVSPTRQLGKVTVYDRPGAGDAGVTVAAPPPATVVVVVPPATDVVVVPPATVVVEDPPATVVVVVDPPATVVVVVVVVELVVSTVHVKLLGPAPAAACTANGVAQYRVV